MPALNWRFPVMPLSPVKPGMTESRRLLAATLGRIYPYRAAKQQAPGVAATDEKGSSVMPGMTGVYFLSQPLRPEKARTARPDTKQKPMKYQP